MVCSAGVAVEVCSVPDLEYYCIQKLQFLRMI